MNETYALENKASIARRENTETLRFGFWHIFIYVQILHMTYIYLYEAIAPLFEYMYLFKSEQIEATKFLATIPYILSIVIFLYQQQRRATISDYFVTIITLCYFLPGISLYLHGNWNSSYFIFHFLSYFFLSLTNELFPHFQRKLIIRREPVSSNNVFKIFSIIISVSVILIIIHYNGFRISLNLEEVYSMREEWSNSHMPNIFNYYIPFAARITPILLLISLRKKNYLITGLLILSQLVSFSFGGMKYTLFALILALVFHFFARRLTMRKILIYILILNIVGVLECMFAFTEIPLFTSFIQRRISFIPNQIGYYYFDFFQNKDYLYYSESFMRWFLDYPFPYDMPHIIGIYAFNKPEMGANTGLFAEGFSQIGWFSLPIYAFLYIILFRLYSFCTNSFEKKGLIYIPLLGVILYSFTFFDGSFFSVLATQGLILTIFTLYYLSKNIHYERK